MFNESTAVNDPRSPQPQTQNMVPQQSQADCSENMEFQPLFQPPGQAADLYREVLAVVGKTVQDNKLMRTLLACKPTEAELKSLPAAGGQEEPTPQSLATKWDAKVKSHLEKRRHPAHSQAPVLIHRPPKTIGEVMQHALKGKGKKFSLATWAEYLQPLAQQPDSEGTISWSASRLGAIVHALEDLWGDQIVIRVSDRAVYSANFLDDIGKFFKRVTGATTRALIKSKYPSTPTTYVTFIADVLRGMQHYWGLPAVFIKQRNPLRAIGK